MPTRALSATRVAGDDSGPRGTMSTRRPLWTSTPISVPAAKPSDVSPAARGRDTALRRRWKSAAAKPKASGTLGAGSGVPGVCATPVASAARPSAAKSAATGASCDASGERTVGRAARRAAAGVLPPPLLAAPPLTPAAVLPLPLLPIAEPGPLALVFARGLPEDSFTSAYFTSRDTAVPLRRLVRLRSRTAS